MRFWSLLPVALSGLLVGLGPTPAGAAAVARASGSLSFNSNKQLATFDYSTPSPSGNNWIGIYPASGGGPVGGQHVDDSTAWDWARDGSGSLTLPTNRLTGGYHYKAYFLGGSSQYELLADPVEFFVPGPGGAASFFVDSTQLINGRVGDDYRARVGGLLHNLPNNNFKFSKTQANNADWVQVSNHGVITGKPTRAGTTTVTIEADNGSGSKSTIRATIKVVDRGAQLVDNINVVSFNIWQGGNNVNNGIEKEIRFIAGASSDIVGLQEAGEHRNAVVIAQALGWYSLQYGDTAMVSKYPIVGVGAGSSHALQARVALDGDAQQVILWNTHPTAYPYGPYDPCFDGKGTDAMMNTEQSSGRASQVEEMMNNMADDIRNADNIPVLLTGDFNAPSHLDWIPSTRNQHCGIDSFGWPTSKLPIQGGLIDSFREQHPNPADEPGITWSPITFKNKGRNEPMDRIDFVYYRGRKLASTRSEAMVVGNPKPDTDNDYRNNEWPSDHRAVRTNFRVSR